MIETKHTRYEKKRKRINLSLTVSEQRLFFTKFKKDLTGPEIKKLLLNGELKNITRNLDPNLAEGIKQLIGVANNLNQIANLANAKKDVPAFILLRQHLDEVRKTINFLRRFR